jgi:hypothetical protein
LDFEVLEVIAPNGELTHKGLVGACYPTIHVTVIANTHQDITAQQIVTVCRVIAEWQSVPSSTRLKVRLGRGLKPYRRLIAVSIPHIEIETPA